MLTLSAERRHFVLHLHGKFLRILKLVELKHHTIVRPHLFSLTIPY